jgi:hypothetical protein
MKPSRDHDDGTRARSTRRVHLLFCVECGSRSGLRADGWRGYRVDAAESGLPPTILFFCPVCASRIFD